MKVCSVQFDIKLLSDKGEFWQRVSYFCEQAKLEGASLILFPEYFSLSWIVHQQQGDFREILIRGSKQQEFLQRFQSIADHLHGLTIVAGTHPFINGNTIINRSWIFQAKAKPLYQDKQNMTRFEKEGWLVSAGDSNFSSFEVNGVKCGVAICYDIEFPSYTQLTAKHGTELLLVPTCTDDIHGYWRVRYCAQARTIENQCFVASSSLIGSNPNWHDIAYHWGGGIIACPSDIGFPEGGILAASQLNLECAIYQQLNIEQLRKIRRQGTVLNLRDSMY